MIFLRRSWGRLAPVTSAFTITARVTAPITSGQVTGELNNSSYLVDGESARASPPVPATSWPRHGLVQDRAGVVAEPVPR
ncbi:hypothetical protein [Actinosynnema pretiosum]|uniref:Uncharacterized protein n=1 Tax=Actinosynnema pretiosum TaxID=42197 RepID=A0A290Z9J3_9PSEU|nr:hypothetical protein [Actinosynnema pretiosum]ATE55711.1 hypothetical protein CNX65_22475 [Actinosynnema pretiosum]